MPKHVFFDLDKTLTTSRSPVASEHADLFLHLCKGHDVIVVTGGNMQSIREQLPFDPTLFYVLAQSGNHAVDKRGTVLWYEELSAEQTGAVITFIEKLKKHFAVQVKDELDLIEHRGAQIGYSVLGYHEDTDKKYAFDPGDKKRVAALKAHSEEVEDLRKIGIEAVPGGTTTINFYHLGHHKGYNIGKLLKHLDWKADECMYVGDALFPGGNDETVIGVIPTHAVKDPEETFEYVKTLL